MGAVITRDVSLSEFTDNEYCYFGSSNDAAIFYDTNDANANHLKIKLPTGDATNVPVISIGIGINVDLGFFNGITEPQLAVLDADRDSYIRLGHKADDEPTLFGYATGRLHILSWGELALEANNDATHYIRINSGAVPTMYGTGAYLRIGDAATTSHALATEDDLMVSGKLEADGASFFDGLVTLGAAMNMSATDLFGVETITRSDSSFTLRAKSGLNFQSQKADASYLTRLALSGFADEVILTVQNATRFIFNSSIAGNYNGAVALAPTLTGTAGSQAAVKINPTFTGDPADANPMFATAIEPVFNIGGGNTHGDLRALWIAAPTISSGTLTNYYALFLDSGGAATSNYAIFVSSGKSRLAPDSVAVGWGNSDDAKFMFDAADANANLFKLDLPAGSATNVPVFALGIGIISVDLGFFNGVTEPRLAIFDSDRNSWIGIGAVNSSGRVGILSSEWIEICPSSQTTYLVKVGAPSNVPTLFGTGAYLRVGDAGTTNHSLASEDDLMVSGIFEVKGYAYFDGKLRMLNNYDIQMRNVAGTDKSVLYVSTSDQVVLSGDGLNIITSAPQKQMNITSAERDFHWRDVWNVDVVAYTTILTITPSTVSQVWTQGIVKAHIMGHTGAVGNGCVVSAWRFAIADNPPTVAVLGTDITEGGGAPAFRLNMSGNNIQVQVRSSNGSASFTGLAAIEVFATHGAGSSGSSMTYTIS